MISILTMRKSCTIIRFVKLTILPKKNPAFRPIPKISLKSRGRRLKPIFLIRIRLGSIGARTNAKSMIFDTILCNII
jgi:hypothetical protein